MPTPILKVGRRHPSRGVKPRCHRTCVSRIRRPQCYPLAGNHRHGKIWVHSAPWINGYGIVYGPAYRNAVTKLKIHRITVYCRYCPRCEGTVSLLPAFVAPYQTFLNSLRELAIRKLTTQASVCWQPFLLVNVLLSDMSVGK